jgi:DNA-binding XRE family transcriptional regulator
MELTNGERFMIDRRRRGENQQEAADRLGKTRSWIWMVEKGQVECPRVALGKIQKHEFAWVLRKRSGMTQEKLGQEIGYSREWVKAMELGRIDALPLFIWWGIA